MKLKAVFFDIDGTLMASSSTGKIALEKAINIKTGIHNALNNIRLHGNTDLIIFKKLKEQYPEKNLTENDFKIIKNMYFEFLPEILCKKSVKTPFDGVIELLNLLKDLSIKTGLVTGNFRKSAYQKLEATNIASYFISDNIGEFGDFSEERWEILSHAIKTSGFSSNEIIFIGDTPYDGEAGKRCNIATIGVTTGIYSAGKLLHSGCDLVLKSLNELDEPLLSSILG